MRMYVGIVLGLLISTPASAQSAEEAVMMFMYGAANGPEYTNVVNADYGNGTGKIRRRTMTIKKVDNCNYEIGLRVTEEDFKAVVSSDRRFIYNIDFSKVGSIGTEIADNAEEAFNYAILDPQSRNKSAYKDKIHKVISIRMTGKQAFCVREQAARDPSQKCLDERGTEISNTAALTRVRDAARYFKTTFCKGLAF